MEILAKVQFENQDVNSYILANELSKKMQNKKLKRVRVVAGVIKDEGFLLLEEAFNVAVQNKVNIDFLIGIDRKTISENVLKKIYEISEKTYIYDNNQDNSFIAKMYIFEYDKTVEIIVPTTNLTANGITSDYSNVVEIIFNLKEDEEEYNKFMYGIKEYIYPSEGIFQLLDESVIKSLSAKRQLLVSKISDVKMPSISEYLKNEVNSKKIVNQDDIEKRINEKLKAIVEDFDVELDTTEE